MHVPEQSISEDVLEYLDQPDPHDLRNYALNKPESYIPDPILYMDGKENATSETKSPGSKKRKSKKKRDELEIER